MNAPEAVLLVGGRGTRLRPLTLDTAKPMLPTAGVPFLAHQLARLRDAGVRHVVMATSYRAETFAEYFGDGSDFGLELEYETEREPLGTGGAIRNVATLLRGGPDDSVIILNGDILSGHDLAEQVRQHANAQADVSLHLVRVPDARAFGCVPTDDAGRVTAFLEKMPEPVTDQINAGCYVFRRGVIDAIPANTVVSVERDTFPGLLASGALVIGYREQAYWLDVGTPAAYVRGSRDLVTGALPSSATPRAQPDRGSSGVAVLGEGVSMHPSAVVTGGAAVGARACIGAGARIEGSVVLEGARVEDGALVRDSIVGRRTVIGARSVIEDAVLGDDVNVGADNELRGGIRLWPGAILGDSILRFSPDE